MDPQPTSAGSRPLPYLPLEVKHHILRFCDPSTLAITSRVSLAFLELSSPILYQDIEIVGLKNLEKLFCSRDPGFDHPHLHPHLSLSHVRNLIIVATSDIGGILKLSPSRFPPPSSSLPVDLLVLRPVGFKTREAERNPQWSSLLPFLDPISVRVVGRVIKPSSRLPCINLETAPWPNLVCLYFDRAACTYFFGTSLFAVSSTTPMTVVFDLAGLWEGEEERVDCRFDCFEEVVAQLGPGCLNGWDEKKLKRFVVKVVSQDDANKLEGWVKELWEGEGRTDWEIHRHRSKVHFEVVVPPKVQIP